MKKVVANFLILMLTVLICLPMTASATANNGYDDRYIAQYIKLYGYTLPTDTIKRIEVNFSPQEAECGQVHVKFDEILYDGQWMYTAASICPQDVDSVLVLPGDADRSDLAAGYYGETVRDDDRSFEQLAYIFTDTELTGLFAQIDKIKNPKHDILKRCTASVLFRLIYTCGLRPGEGYRLKKENVNLDTGEIFITETKQK